MIQADVDQASQAVLSDGSLLTKAYSISAAPYGGAIDEWEATKTFIDVRVRDKSGTSTSAYLMFMSRQQATNQMTWQRHAARPTCENELFTTTGTADIANRATFKSGTKSFTTYELDDMFGVASSVTPPNEPPSVLKANSFVDVPPDASCSSSSSSCDHTYYVPEQLTAPEPLEVPGFLLRPHHTDADVGECT